MPAINVHFRIYQGQYLYRGCFDVSYIAVIKHVTKQPVKCPYLLFASLAVEFILQMCNKYLSINKTSIYSQSKQQS